MKIFSSGVFSLVFAGYIYMQAFNVSMDMLKRMQVLMSDASTQLAAVNSPVKTNGSAML